MSVFDPPFGIPGDIDLEPVPPPMHAVSALAPAWAMAAQALMASDQQHLRTGLHLRVMTNPLLGLPITPFRIIRAGRPPALRTDIIWTDDSPLPRRLNPPFQVTPDRPAIGWLPAPASATCCWIEVAADVDAGDDLRVSAMASTPRGSRPVASRSWRPYHVWASAITQIRVEGTGTVEGVEWLPASTAGGELLKLMALPLARPHPRYAAVDNGVLLAAARVARGAPQRRALHDTSLAGGLPEPFDADPLTIAEEVARVARLAEVLRPELLRLVDEQLLEPWSLSTASPLVNEHGEIGDSSATTNCLDTVLDGTVDHGLARWLGFLDNDVLGLSDNPIDARIVTAVFAPNWREINARFLQFTIPPDAVIADMATLRSRYPGFEALGDLEGTVTGPFLDIGVVAAFSSSGQIDSPPAPVAVSVTDRPTRTSDVEPGALSAWVPRVPPDAARLTEVVLDGLRVGAAVAFARENLDGTDPVVLNPPSAAPRFNQPLVAALTDNVSSADTGDAANRGTLAERDCPPQAVRYHAAQVDWFGRWSGWTAIDLADGDRPRPPVPAVRAWATQAAAPPDEGGPLSGTISARVPVPPPTDLPPGAHLITSLRFQVTDAAGDTTTTTIPIADPASPPPELAIDDLVAPAIGPGESTTVTVSAHWTDTSFARSDPSPDLHLTISDARPPAPVELDPTLRYTARPDVTGLARVELRWPAASPQEQFRVYVADETTMRARLAAILEGGTAPDGDLADIATLLAALDDAPGPAERGVVWTDHASVLPRSAFTLATPTPIPRTGTEMRFEHAVSGSLRVLTLYRVVAVSAANVDVAFADSPVVPFAVPNTLPPPQPQLAARIIDPSTSGMPVPVAELTVTIPRGSRRAVEYRLRRSRVSAADPLLMPVVATGVLHPPGGPDPHVEVVTDTGPTSIEPDGVLRPWNTYSWRVEVRGEPEPGDGPPGSWSQPSQPAGASVVPVDRPAPPVIRSLRRRAGNVFVAVDVPTDLRGGTLGVHTVEVYRRLPDDHERLLAARPEQLRPAGATPWVFVDDGSTGAPGPGTTYRAVVVDPLGRRSDPSALRRLPRARNPAVRSTP